MSDHFDGDVPASSIELQNKFCRLVKSVVPELIGVGYLSSVLPELIGVGFKTLVVRHYL